MLLCSRRIRWRGTQWNWVSSRIVIWSHTCSLHRNQQRIKCNGTFLLISDSFFFFLIDSSFEAKILSWICCSMINIREQISEDALEFFVEGSHAYLWVHQISLTVVLLRSTVQNVRICTSQGANTRAVSFYLLFCSFRKFPVNFVH